MNMEKFKIQFINLLEKSLETNAAVSLKKETLKGKLQEAVKIVLHKEDRTFVISIESLYRIFQTGVDIPDIADMVLASIFSSISLDSSKIIYGLVNASEHKELLKNVPHIPFYDMAIIFKHVTRNRKTENFLIISNELMKKNHLTIRQLTEFAQENTFRLFPCATTPLVFDSFRVLMEDPDATLKDFLNFAKTAFFSKQQHPSFTATCENYKNGSVALLNTAFLSDISEKLGHDLLLLPASDQVFVIMPFTGDLDKNHIFTMVENALKEGDSTILTHNVFFFNKNTKRLEPFV